MVDFSAGYVAAIALLAGVWRARRDGVGGDVDLSLFETALSLLTYMGTWAASREWEPRRMPDSAHQTVIPFQMFPAADGHLVVACAKESLWRKLCAALGEPELADDERFADFAARNRHRDVLLPHLKKLFGRRTVAEWTELLVAAGIPCAPVNDIDAALADEQARARGALVQYDHPVLGEVATVASPYGRELTRPVTRGPLLGEDGATRPGDTRPPR
jgi:crotonobetainyl-CoA:carnitine CoA-transferase CaiB-like acyl-CoA transferase